MLHKDDLIFCKTESGVTSCGYNISNMLLKNTLNMSDPNTQYSSMGKMGSVGSTSKDDIRIAKLMEDLVVPSGLYYCHPMTKHKVFNYKPMQSQSLHSPREKGEKGEKNEINIVNGMLDESTYDKLLSLVSMDKKRLFDRKTRKNKNTFQKIKEGSTASDVGIDIDVDLELPKEEKGEKGEKREKSTKKKSIKLKINTQKLLENQQEKQKPNQRKTKKVRFADF
jgi:hypothetical protein